MRFALYGLPDLVGHFLVGRPRPLDARPEDAVPVYHRQYLAVSGTRDSLSGYAGRLFLV